MDYPTKIESLDTLMVEDETGFLNSEKLALISSWERILKTKKKRYAVETFIEFYTKYPRFLKMFQDENENFNLNLLNSHAYQVYDVLGEIIESLTDTMKVNAILQNLAEIHMGKNIYQSDIELPLEIIKKQLKRILRRHSSLTLENAIDKLVILIKDAFVP